jgi:hypothetical protein
MAELASLMTSGDVSFSTGPSGDFRSSGIGVLLTFFKRFSRCLLLSDILPSFSFNIRRSHQFVKPGLVTDHEAVPVEIEYRRRLDEIGVVVSQAERDLGIVLIARIELDERWQTVIVSLDNHVIRGQPSRLVLHLAGHVPRLCCHGIRVDEEDLRGSAAGDDLADNFVGLREVRQLGIVDRMVSAGDRSFQEIGGDGR